ncbi:hypothetical protein [Parabacteroides merdae]|uniref:hypothetical protein n=1 Tax=Parabacteroides merdae TaxID=46503 RepID=UPI0022E67297|nr:hypothetical protein [Parabacteroides merdae]
MGDTNRRNRNKNAQKKRTERRMAPQQTSSDCQSLHLFSSDERGTSVFIDKRATSYRIEATSTHLDKGGWNGWFTLVHLPATSCRFP